MDIGSGPSGGLGVTYPASLAQARFWVLDALDPGTPSLNVAVRWTLLGTVTPGMVEPALRRVIARHEIIRTALVDEDGQPMQLVRPSAPFRLAHFDLSQQPDAETEADRIGEEEASTPFSLESAPLIRATLITLSPDRSRLLLTLHHAVCDGWSIGVIAAEFMAALNGKDSPPELPLQYGDYAQWQQAWLRSPALDEATAYWKKQLAALPYIAIDADHAGDGRGPGKIESVLLPRELTDQMAASAAQIGCTPFAVALAGLGRIIQARTGAVDIPIGTQVAGRTEVELEDMVGPFINTLVLRLDVSGEPAWNERVRRAADVVRDALDHHEMPFEMLIRALNPPRVPRRSPLFAINFIFQRSFVAPEPGGAVALVDMPSHSAGALYDLNFFMVERPDGWRASCEYDSALYEAATIQAMLAEWQAALAGQAVAPRAKASGVNDQLGAIWCEILALPSVAPTDSFFDLGGHSLLAARMLAKVEAVFGQRIGMTALFEDPTLNGLAAQLGPGAQDDRMVMLASGESGPTCVAIGKPAAWQPVASAIGSGSFACISEDEAEGAAGQLPRGRIFVLGAGRLAGAAMRTAQALQARGDQPILVLLDGALPRSKLLSRLRPGSRAGSFGGRVLLFTTPGGTGDGLADWAPLLTGSLEVAPTEPALLHQAVAARLAALGA